ncbi:GNAT family N-acetyltransferase [[Clostridium] fimetarium]|uniref:Predicted N-acetyltransferase YhbS n=1 Tax=[Clostridium] fimetarium TaxID=99656 RepID=A0A1I0RXP7_9FIRM|nr:GNAT family N-acetyltransferase [[Clostridium] fimetarium]SEW46312.1 Predicted N-acetyltransferase YhbS [[Clostridium] fimetarium]
MIYEIIDEKYIPKLAELYVETYNSPSWNDEWTISLATQKLYEMINCRDSYGLICLDDASRIVGMIVGSSEVYYNCKQFFIKDFFVIPTLQGKGIGSGLMKKFESQLKGKGIDKTYLFTSRTDSTENYYQKRGYKNWNSMVIMGKNLNE